MADMFVCGVLDDVGWMGGMLVAGAFVLVGCNADALLCTSCLMKDAFANAGVLFRVIVAI
jgi:hypothetical protein